MNSTIFLALVAAVGLGMVYQWLDPWVFWSCYLALAGIVALEMIE